MINTGFSWTNDMTAVFISSVRHFKLFKIIILFLGVKLFLSAKLVSELKQLVMLMHELRVQWSVLYCKHTQEEAAVDQLQLSVELQQLFMHFKLRKQKDWSCNTLC